MLVFILYVVAVLLQIIAVTIHSIGIHLLRRLQVDGEGDVQQIYLFNISAVEIIGTFCFLLQSCLMLSMASGDAAFEYTHIVLLTVCSFVLYMNMLYVTLDKALEVFLNIKYPIYWSRKKAKCLEIATWSIGLLMCIGFITAFNIVQFRCTVSLTTYFRPPLDIVILITVTLCYSYIFVKYKNSRVLPTQRSTESTSTSSINQQSVFTVFRNSSFFVSVCLIATFLLFVVIPDIIQFTRAKDEEAGNDDHGERRIKDALTFILLSVSFISDACIYILLHKKVKRLLLKELRHIGCMAPVIITEGVTRYQQANVAV